MMKLQEIRNKIINNNNLVAARLEVESLSYPVAGLENGKIVERYFLFSNQPDVKKRRPYAWLCIECETGRFLRFEHCSVKDFAAELHASLSEEVDYGAPMEGAYREVLAAKREYSALYEDIREFVFSDELGAEQKEKVMRYEKLQNQIISEQLLAYYRMLSPEFYLWIEKFS